MAEVLRELGGDLFQFNREGWKFGAVLRQRDLYQRQKMRIKQVDLYRDDIRDLFELTVGKMDKYVIVCLVMLSITMELFFKGRNPVGTPSWLFWSWAICTSGAMLYLLMSIWLALHASISAQTFSVRCLTQWLRLPIPSAEEIAKGAAKLEEYEKTGATSLLRVPVLGKADELANGLADTNTQGTTTHDLTTDWQLFTSHFNLFNRLHRKWQGYEAYSRVCMCLGMNHFLAAMSYFSLAVYALELQSPWAGWAFVTIFQGSALLHARLNLNLTFSETTLMIALVMIPSMFLSIAVAVTMTSPISGGIDHTKYDLAPCLFACVGILGHIGWIIFFLIQTKSDINGLPVKFSTVWCIDVLGFGMETLREVQEPVGKATYTARLPGYTKDGPRNIFELGNKVGVEEVVIDDPSSDAAEEEVVAETKESRKRSRLPWVVFKIGSFFTVVLWVIALAQTLMIPLGVDTGIGDVTARRLLAIPAEFARPRRVTVPSDMKSARGFSDTLIASERRVFNTATGEMVKCEAPSHSIFHGIAGTEKRLLALLRETSAVVDCRSGRIISTPQGKLDAIASRETASGDFDLYAFSEGHIKYLDRQHKVWVPVKDSIDRCSAGCSLGIRGHDEMVVVLNQKTQKIDKYDISSGEFIGSVSVASPKVVWTHVSGRKLLGIHKTGKYRVIGNFS